MKKLPEILNDPIPTSPDVVKRGSAASALRVSSIRASRPVLLKQFKQRMILPLLEETVGPLQLSSKTRGSASRPTDL